MTTTPVADAPRSTTPTPAAFLDRDDTLIRRVGGLPTGDLGDPDAIELIPGAAEALAALRAAGFRLVVYTNQGGVARGSYPESAVHAVHRRLSALLSEAGLPPSPHTDGAIDAYRHCPYHPGGTVAPYAAEHPWRKPAPGMVLDAAASLDLHLPASVAIGDAPRDLLAATAAGIPLGHCCLVTADPDRVATATAHGWHATPDIAGAAEIVIAAARAHA